jgi:hypothetical protein
MKELYLDQCNVCIVSCLRIMLMGIITKLVSVSNVQFVCISQTTSQVEDNQ